jgi:hypothetical protein
LVPGRVRTLNRAPLNPPTLTSYGEVTSEDMTPASRGSPEAPKLRPLSVVWFWSAERPSTENPAGSPSAPGTGVTPGCAAAAAAKSPSWSGATAAGSTARSVPPTSGAASARPMRGRSPRTVTRSSVWAARWRVASARRKSSSPTRLTSKRRAW